jgi:hypothetical protein
MQEELEIIATEPEKVVQQLAMLPLKIKEAPVERRGPLEPYPRLRPAISDDNLVHTSN